MDESSTSTESNTMLESEIPLARDIRMAWFCPLKVEQEAAIASMDMEYKVDMDEYMQLHRLQGDLNVYRLGKIGDYHIVICRPSDERAGPLVAALAWRDLSRSFPEVQHLLIVGIGGGVPNVDKNHDVRPGDVVIGLAGETRPGMIQLDAGKQNENFKPLMNINSTTVVFQAMANKLIDYPKRPGGKRANIFLETADAVLKKSKSTYPGLGQDCCFVVGSTCNDKKRCPKGCRNTCNQTHRPERSARNQVVHGGLICSSSREIRSARFRDDTVAKYQDEIGQILVFETKGYSIASEIPCLMIRGISSYSDCHNTAQWQPYAAAHAAAAARIITILFLESRSPAKAARTSIQELTRVHGNSGLSNNKLIGLFKAQNFALVRTGQSQQSGRQSQTTPSLLSLSGEPQTDGVTTSAKAQDKQPAKTAMLVCPP